MLSFGYKSPLKDVVNLCAYTGKPLPRHQRTLEHIRPHSKNGKNTLSNFLITEAKINHQRGNQRFDKWLKDMPAVVKNIQNYLDKFRGLRVGGVDYVEVVKKTLNREARGVVVFRGLDVTI